MPIEANTSRRGINIYAKAGSAAIATQDGRVVKIGKTKRLGHFIQIQDVYGNTYTYAQLKKVAVAYAVPKAEKVSKAQVAKELGLPKKDPKPTQAASAGSQPKAAAAKKSAVAGRRRRTPPATKVTVVGSTRVNVSKERAFANPSRPASYKQGGEEQLLNREFQAGGTSYQAQFTKVLGLDSKDVTIKKLKVGSKVVAGTILGRVGKTQKHVASHLLFEIRPAGKGAPRIDPKPILDGWKLLESTAIYRAAGKNPFFGPDAKNPSIGQILLMSKESLQRRVLTDSRIEIYDCGRTDIRAGNIDRRVLATLEFLSASGLKPTVTSLECGHGVMTASGNISEHSSGSAVDIAAINGIPILGHQGEGSITDMTIRRLLTLQGTMKPHQIISLMTFDGADNTLSLPDHADHIHVGFRPLYGSDSKLGRQLNSALKPKQWIKLIDRLGQIDNPKVLTSPSKYAIDDPKTSDDAGRARQRRARRRVALWTPPPQGRASASSSWSCPGSSVPPTDATSCAATRASPSTCSSWRPSAREPRRRLLRRRAAAPSARPRSPALATVPVTVATLVAAAPLGDDDVAAAWLEGADLAAEVHAAVAVLNTVLHAERLVRADPFVREIAAEQALAIRVGIGNGEEVAHGHWADARTLPPAATARRKRERALRPQERFAALLAGRDVALAAEELTLRARLDLDRGRTREAALQLRIALEAALAELQAWSHHEELATRLAELRDERAGRGRGGQPRAGRRPGRRADRGRRARPGPRRGRAARARGRRPGLAG